MSLGDIRSTAEAILFVHAFVDVVILFMFPCPSSAIYDVIHPPVDISLGCARVCVRVCVHGFSGCRTP